MVELGTFSEPLKSGQQAVVQVFDTTNLVTLDLVETFPGLSGKMWNIHKSGLAAFTLLSGVLGADILQTNGFTNCINDSTITVNNLNVQYDRTTNLVTFDVSGSSAKSQEVTASLTVSAYGKQVYQTDFDPCDQSTLVPQLCPGKFAIALAGSTSRSWGSQELILGQCQ